MLDQSIPKGLYLLLKTKNTAGWPLKRPCTMLPVITNKAAEIIIHVRLKTCNWIDCTPSHVVIAISVITTISIAQSQPESEAHCEKMIEIRFCAYKSGHSIHVQE